MPKGTCIVYEADRKSTDEPNFQRNGQPSVDVAMATYNGSLYLDEQIRSIEDQTYPGISIYLSDDKSTDNTVEIVGNRPIVKLSIKNERNIGPAQNFWKALSLCISDYVAFCDQDDTWDDKKVEILMERMMLIEAIKGKHEPILVYSDLTLVDKSLGQISRSFFSTTGKRAACADPRDFIISNHIPGCTMLLNRALIGKAGELPTDVRMHDWWIALIASLSGTLSFVDKPLIKYRQHASNAVGAPSMRKIPSVRSLVRFYSYARKRAGISNAIIRNLRELYSGEVYNAGPLPGWVLGKFSIRDRIYMALNRRSGEGRALSIVIACMIK